VEIQLTDDQQLFVETTRRFLDTESPMARVRELCDDPLGYGTDYWRRAAALGWTSLLTTEALGGGNVSGSGLLDLVLVAEEVGRRVAPGPLGPVNVVAKALSDSGATGDHAALLSDLLAGEQVAAWALAEGDGRWDAEGVELEAHACGSDWELSGTKAYVQDAAGADWLLVVARTGASPDELSQLLVPREAPGLGIVPLVSLDIVRRYARVTFDGVRVPATAVVGEVGAARECVDHQLQTALALQHAETVGATDRVFEITLAYCMDRVSFGRPIGSYQAIKHRLADLKLWLEACHATATAASRAVQERSPGAAELVSVAKAYIGDRCPAIVQDCVQLHGGIGVTWDADLHIYLRRVAQNAALLGTVSQHRELLATRLGLEPPLVR